MGFAVTVDGRTSGVSGASVVAGEGGSDEANSGNTIGKSEMLNCGTTGPLGTEYFSTGGGTNTMIIRERTSVANRSPHAHVKCVVGGRLFSVVQPKYKIVFAHILPEEKVLLVTDLSMYSSMCLSNVGVELCGRHGRSP